MISFFSSQFWKLLKPTKNTVVRLIIGGILIALLEMGALIFLLALGSAVFGQPIPSIMHDTLNALAITSTTDVILALAVSFLGILLLKFAATVLYTYRTATWRIRVLTSLQTEVMDKLLNTSLELYFRKKQGDLINGVYNLPYKATEGLTLLPKVFSSAAMLVAVGAMLFYLSPWMLLGIVGIGLVMGLVVTVLSRRFVLPSNRGRVEASRAQAEITAETTSGIREIKFLSAESLWSKLFKKQVVKFNWLWRKEYMAMMAPNQFLLWLVQGGFALSLAVAAMTVSAEQILTVLPVLATYGYGILRIYPSFTAVGQGIMGIIGSLAHINALAPWRDLPYDPLAASGVAAAGFQRDLRFDKINFSYNAESLVLKEVSFSISANKITALVGKSGSGKSTVIDLILKFVQPKTGQITVDDIDLQKMDRTRWLSGIGFVDQDVFLFHETIAENVRLSKREATDEEILSACKHAGLTAFINSLPDGIQTVIGDRGLTISGGERQRIAIARALIRNPSLLIFDEATSSLDSETESKVLETLWNLKKNRTIIIIAHRLNTIKTADHIVVLDTGKCRETGTWRDLLAHRGVFWRLALEQGVIPLLEQSHKVDAIHPSPSSAITFEKIPEEPHK